MYGLFLDNSKFNQFPYFGNKYNTSLTYYNDGKFFGNINYANFNPLSLYHPLTRANIKYQSKDCNVQPIRKRRRNLFSRYQTLQLKRKFRKQRYLSSVEREHLAAMLNLTATQVYILVFLYQTKFKRFTSDTIFMRWTCFYTALKESYFWMQPNFITIDNITRLINPEFGLRMVFYGFH